MKNTLLIIAFVILFIAGIVTALFGFGLLFKAFEVEGVWEAGLGIASFITGMTVMFIVAIKGFDPETYEK